MTDYQLTVQPLSTRAGRPTAPARVVYTAMKPQLRGRIRRNVSTLLEVGADVTVLTVRTNKDFFVGLEHPRLHVEFLAARSVYVRFAEHASRRSRQRAERRAARLDGTTHPPFARRVVMAPVYLLGGLAFLVRRGFARLRGVPAPVPGPGRSRSRDVSTLRSWWRRLPLGVRRPAWLVARRLVRIRARYVRFWNRRIRGPVEDWILHQLPENQRRAAESRRDQRALRGSGRWSLARRNARRRRLLLSRAILRRRRAIRRMIINRQLAVSRAFVRRVKDALRPWHRVNRFYAFWRESFARAVELEPDLVVSSDLPGLVGAGRAARSLAIPHLHDCHELYLESTSFRRVERLLLTRQERRWMRRASAVVAVNESIALEYAQRYGRRPGVVRNCSSRLDVELAPRDLRSLVGLPESTRIVLYQGGFSIGRGLDTCVAAVAGLPADAHLVLLGFGPLRDALVAQAQSLEVADRVHVLDAVSPDELPSLTASATVGLIPYQPVSLNNYLALPNKVFEYTAVGVPIVVSDLPELRRIALDEGCGRVYDPYDADSLALALRQILDPPAHASHQWSARRFGELNVWETERTILVTEMIRLCPQLHDDPLLNGPLHPDRPMAVRPAGTQ